MHHKARRKTQKQQYHKLMPHTVPRRNVLLTHWNLANRRFTHPPPKFRYASNWKKELAEPGSRHLSGINPLIQIHFLYSPFPFLSTTHRNSSTRMLVTSSRLSNIGACVLQLIDNIRDPFWPTMSRNATKTCFHNLSISLCISLWNPHRRIEG